MGCPPDPYEVSMSHDSDETRRLAEKASTFLYQLNKSFSVMDTLIRQMGEEKIIGEYKTSLAKLKKAATGINIDGIEKRFSWGDVNVNQEDTNIVDYSRISGHINDAEKKIKELEIILCKTRDVLLKMYRTTKPHVTEDLSKKLEEEIAYHLDHRKDDRQVKLKILKTSLAADEKYLKGLSKTDANYKFYDDLIKLSIAEIERISKLTDEELLTSRDIF